MTKEAIIKSNKPLLVEIESMYSFGTIKTIIGAYLYKFQSLLNLKDEVKMDSDQINICAMNIIPLLRGLTLGEIVMMFNRFASGEFGKFYGNVDIMTIGEWVREFKRKRGKLIIENNDIRKFLVLRDQNYDEDKISWRDENTTK